MDREKIEIFYR